MVRAEIALHSSSRALVSRMVRAEIALHSSSRALVSRMVRAEIALHSSSRALVSRMVRAEIALHSSSRALVSNSSSVRRPHVCVGCGDPAHPACAVWGSSPVPWKATLN